MNWKRHSANLLALVGCSIATQALAVVVTSHIARRFGPDGFGEITLVATIAMFAGILANPGIGNFFNREVARGQDIRANASLYFFLKLILGLVSGVGMIIAGLALHKSLNFIVLCSVWAVGLPVAAADFRWYFTARQAQWFPAGLTMISQALCTLLVLKLVLSPTHTILYVALSLLCLGFIPAAVSTAVFVREFGMPQFRFLAPVWAKLKKEVSALAVSNTCMVVNQYFAPLLVGSFISLKDLGIYSAAFKVMMVATMFYSLVTLVTTPAVANLFGTTRDRFIERMKIFLLLMVSAGVLMSLTMTLLAPLIIDLLFGDGYARSIPILRVWTIGLLPVVPISIVFASSLIPCNAAKEYSRVALAATACSIGSTVLISRFGGVWALPFANVLSETVMAAGGFYYSVRVMKLTRREIASLLNLWSSAGIFWRKAHAELVARGVLRG